MLSPAARFMSATGTYAPSIWQEEFPSWILVMSLRPGTSTHPDSDVSSGTSRAAPHRGQLNCPSETFPHQAHFTEAECPCGRGRDGDSASARCGIGGAG